MAGNGTRSGTACERQATPAAGQPPSESYAVAETLQQMPSLIARGLTYVALLAAGVGLAYACWAKVDITIQGRAVAQSQSGVAGGPLCVDLTVSSRDVSFLQEGMPVCLKFDAFPYLDFGALMGEITTVSPSPVPDGHGGYEYHAQVNLGQAHVAAKGKQYPIQAGMAATAEVVVERRTLASFLVGRFVE
jgi:multidrug efflux pump subunit AcrA (membrane-fusion protein)